MTETDLSTLTGLELLRHATSMDEPPPSIGRLLGMRFDEIEEGHVVMSLDTRRDFSNPLGTVHGGICATLLDSVMGCAVHTHLAAGVGYTTLELKVNYIRAVATDAVTLVATGITIHVGRRVATAEGKVHNEKGQLVAHATTTCLIL